MASTRATWDGVNKRMVQISQSPRAANVAGETSYTTTTTTSSSRAASPIRRAASPSRVVQEVYDDGGETYQEMTTSRSVVSPSNIDVEPRSARSVMRNAVVRSSRSRSSSPVREVVRMNRSRSSSPVRQIIKEIHHYENDVDEGVNEEVEEVRHVVKSNAGAASKKVTQVHNYENVAEAPVIEKVREIHHYVNDAPAAAAVQSTKRVSEVHQYAKPAVATEKVVKEVRHVAAPARSPASMKEVVREMHHYDQTPRATNNIKKTTISETSRAASPPAKASIVKQVSKETRMVRDNNHYNDANAGVHQTSRTVTNVSHAKSNLNNTNINTHNVVNENVNRSSSIKNVSSTKSVLRDSSPEKKSGCFGRSSKSNSSNNSSSYNSSNVNHSTNRVDDYTTKNRHSTVNNHHSSYTRSSMGADVGRRRCCAMCLGLLGLLLLGGLIAGMYFGIKSALDKKEASRASNQYNQGYGNSGYYVNGVYVIPVTAYDSRIYLIYGEDVPCNKYNNNTDTTDETPDCEDLTTSIAVANWTTTIGPVVNAVPIVANNEGCRSTANPAFGLFVLMQFFYTLHTFYFQLET